MIIGDKDEVNVIFQDLEIEAFLALNSSDVRLAAADALDSMASNEAYVQKHISLLELSTDGASTAKALRDHADRLRTLADVEDAGEDGGSFDYAEMPETEFQKRERVIKQAQRGLV
jgi:hypothetical protein